MKRASGQTPSLAILLLVVCGTGVVLWSAQPNGGTRNSQAENAEHPHARATVVHARERSGNMANALQQAESAAANPPEAELRQARCVQVQRQQWLARRDGLDPTTEPDQAVGHAFLTQLLTSSSEDPDPAAVAREFQEARERWPQDVALAWFGIQHCATGQGCDRDAAWRHLQQLDPDNAAVWLLAMEDALQRKDDLAYGQALQRAADARFYDTRAGTTFVHARRLLLSVPVVSDCQVPGLAADLQEQFGRPPRPEDFANIHANAIEIAFGLPSLNALSGCRAGAQLSASRRRDCRTLLSRVATGETLFEQQVALGLLIPLVGNGPGHASLRERYRRQRWLMSAGPRLKHADDFAARMWAEGEVAVLQSLAIAQGQWPPPQRWMPADARGRALIQTGRLPQEQRRHGPT